MKLDPESQQMPKRSIKDNRAKSMTGGMKKAKNTFTTKPKKPSNTAYKQTATGSTGHRPTVVKGPTRVRAASSNIGLKKPPVNIPMKDMSPEFKKIVVEELIRTGKARVVTRRGRKTMAKEEEEKRKKDQKEEVGLVCCKV